MVLFFRSLSIFLAAFFTLSPGFSSNEEELTEGQGRLQSTNEHSLVQEWKFNFRTERKIKTSRINEGEEPLLYTVRTNDEEGTLSFSGRDFTFYHQEKNEIFMEGNQYIWSFKIATESEKMRPHISGQKIGVNIENEIDTSGFRTVFCEFSYKSSKSIKLYPFMPLEQDIHYAFTLKDMELVNASEQSIVYPNSSQYIDMTPLRISETNSSEYTTAQYTLMYEELTKEKEQLTKLLEKEREKSSKEREELTNLLQKEREKSSKEREKLIQSLTEEQQQRETAEERDTCGCGVF